MTQNARGVTRSARRNSEEHTMKTNNSILVTAPEIAKDLGISTTSAYKLIHKWNAELEAKNYTTISGKVSRRYYYERIYGMNAPADNGEAM